jgi:hypothetical protein
MTAYGVLTVLYHQFFITVQGDSESFRMRSLIYMIRCDVHGDHTDYQATVGSLIKVVTGLGIQQA